MPENYQPPKDLMPPPGTVVGPNGNLVAVGPPYILPNGPNLVDPNLRCRSASERDPRDQRPAMTPRRRFPAPPTRPSNEPPTGDRSGPVAGRPVDPWPPGFLPGNAGPHIGDPGVPGPLPHCAAPIPAPPPQPVIGPLPAEAAPASYGGNVGPVGSAGTKPTVLHHRPAGDDRHPVADGTVRGMTVSPGEDTATWAMNIRKQAIGLAIFLVVTTVMTWLVYATLQRQVTGRDHRIRGGVHRRVRPARKATTSGWPASASARCPGSSWAAARPAARPGSTSLCRTIRRSPGQHRGGDPLPEHRRPAVPRSEAGQGRGLHPLPGGTVIPRTIPSFDVGIVLNGYEPLFATIDPKAADQISEAAVQALSETPPRGRPWSTSPARSPRPSPVATNCWAT